MKIKKFDIFYLAFVFVFILILVKSWLPSGYIVAGHDSGLALDAGNFLKTRFYAWDEGGFGSDNSAHFGSIILHGIDYITSLVANTPYAGNFLNVFFWIFLLFLSSFIFSSQLRDKFGNVFSYIFPPLLTFNFFIIQSLFILERAKYSIIIASLFFLLLSIKVIDKKLKPIMAGVIASLIFFVFNSGSWLGLPLYGGLLVIFLAIIVYSLLETFRTKDKKIFLKLLAFLLISGIGFLLVNSYSILPYGVTFLRKDYSSLVSSEVVLANVDWLNFLSQAGSFLNIFRMAATPDWWATKDEINFSHPYAGEYLGSPLLIFISILIAMCAFYSFAIVRNKQRNTLGLFGLMIIFSMPFIAGSHEPFGFLYELIFRYIPGFPIFRSPYFKFGYPFFIGFSALLSVAISQAKEKFSKENKLIALFIPAIFLTTWFYYHGVIFKPEKVLSWQNGYSTRLKVPFYIEDFKKFIESKNYKDGRVLLVPGANELWQNDAYNWGYWSLMPLPATFGNGDYLLNTSLLVNERIWVNRIYLLIKKRDEAEILRISKMLGIKYFLLRKDVLADFSWSAAEPPQQYEKIIDSLSFLKKEKEIGEWALYRISSDMGSKIYGESKITIVPRSHSYLSSEFVREGRTVLDNYVNFLDEKNMEYKELNVYSCQSCLLETRAIESLPVVNITSESLFYFIKDLREKQTLSESRTDESQITAYLGFSLRRTAEVKRMLDLDTHSRYISSNLETIAEYLDRVYNLLLKTAKPEQDFFRAKQILDFLNPIELNFRIIVSRGVDLVKRPASVREDLLSVLWKINEIKNIYPLAVNPSDLSSNKQFEINVTRVGEQEIFINKLALPNDVDGSTIYPNAVLLNGVEQQFFPIDDGDWIRFNLVVPNQGAYKVSLVFDNLPNLFSFQKASEETTPFAKISCILGEISSFRRSSSYNISVYADKGQKLTLYIKQDDGISPATNIFLEGGEVTVDPLLSTKPFTHLFVPSDRSVNTRIYVCSDTIDEPLIREIKITEVIFPILVVKPIKQGDGDYSPTVTFEKINPTKYIVNIDSSESPFTLVFSEAYSPLWSLRKDGEKKQLNSQVIVDGWANGWVIEGEGSGKYTLEYRPQKMFFIGLGTSLVSILFMLGYILLKAKIKKT